MIRAKHRCKAKGCDGFTYANTSLIFSQSTVINWQGSADKHGSIWLISVDGMTLATNLNIFLKFFLTHKGWKCNRLSANFKTLLLSTQSFTITASLSLTRSHTVKKHLSLCSAAVSGRDAQISAAV